MSELKIEKLTLDQAQKAGFRSTLELYVAKCLRQIKKKFRYEKVRIKYYVIRKASYLPDFILDNGIIIETKGWFRPSDRAKHIRIKQQHPNLDIRFIFDNAENKISARSKTTYAAWCEKHGFKYATRVIPQKWLKEKGTDNYPRVIEADKKGLEI